MSNESSHSLVAQPAIPTPAVPPEHTDRAGGSAESRPAYVDSALAQVKGETASIFVRGSLDVMGGIAEYCGALSVSAPSRDRAVARVTLREDQTIGILVCNRFHGQNDHADNDHAGNDHANNGKGAAGVPVEWKLNIFYGDGDKLATSEQVFELGCSRGGESLGLALASLRVLLAAKSLPHFSGGLTLTVESGLTGDVLRRRAALVTVILRSVLTAFGIKHTVHDIAVFAQRVLEDVSGYPCGLATTAAPMIDRPGFVSPICCRPLDIGEVFALPAGVTLLGIDSGVLHPKAAEKYRHARTTSLMGCAIIARLVNSALGDGSEWHGHLARVTSAEYVDRFRDILPTKLKGAMFLDRFGPLKHRSATVDPTATYKIRSRTEHHIYEDERVRQFVERIARACRMGDEQAVIEAGELMYASHWSYGQRCGLGSRETDSLVSLLRKCGLESGIYGARISGSGCGGTVVVLMRDSDETREAIADSVREYEQRTKFKTTLQPVAGLNS